MTVNLSQNRNPFEFQNIFGSESMNGTLDTAAANHVNAAALRTLMDQRNADIADHIRARRPQNTYTRILVGNIRYDFNGRAGEPVDTKVITLYLPLGITVLKTMGAFFAGLGLFESPEMTQQVDRTALAEQIERVIASASGPRDQIVLAFKQVRTIEFYLAKDLRYSDVEIKTSGAVVAYRTGEWVKTIGLIARTLLPLLSRGESTTTTSTTT